MSPLLRLLALLALVMSALCCAPKASPVKAPAPAAAVPSKAPDVTEVRVWREVELVMHVDTGFTDKGRTAITRAAERVRQLTKNKANLTVAFDVDFDSVDNLREHKDAGHSLMVAVASDFDIVAYIDSSINGTGTVLAATTDMKDGSKMVFLILDRIANADADFETVVTHELGHVIGLPDLDVLGAIMSGHSQRGVAEPKDWTPADLELCRRERLCD